MTVWIYGDIHMCGVASLILRKLWGVTQIWLMILVRLQKTLRTAFSVCFLSTFSGELWLFEYMGVMSQVWSCLTNCEKTVRCDADLIDDSCEALKHFSNGVFRMSLSTFWGELWLFEYMGIMSQVWSCLTNCEKTVKCDADLINDSCEAFLRLFERPFPYVSIDFLRWAMTVWIYGDIHMCGVASLIVRKLWGVTQIWLMILVRLQKTLWTAFFVCLYRLFEVSYGCLNIWGLCHRCEVASLIVRKLWGVTQIWLMILVRLCKTFRTAFSVCLYRLFQVSYGCLNIWGLCHRCEVASLIVRKL